MQYSKFLHCISIIFTASSTGVDFIYFLCSSIRINPLNLLKFYHKTAAIQSHFQAPFLILVLLLFPPHLQFFLHWSLQSHPWRSESTSSKSRLTLKFWPLGMNHECYLFFTCANPLLKQQPKYRMAHMVLFSFFFCCYINLNINNLFIHLNYF